MKEIIKTNQYQTKITRELLEQYPDEVADQFLDFIDTVPLIKWMIGERPRAKDLPRDEQGRIIVDIAHPHILEDMDYFRPSALFYKENGCYSLLKPNGNPNSEYGKWFAEEVRRCRYGYVRESDGEWVTGLMYFYLNYCPIMLNRLDEETGVYIRVEDFPDFWEGIYYRFHYIDQARHAGKHCMELARRGCSKSFTLASIMTRNLILGERKPKPGERQRLATVLTAYTKEYLADKDGTFTKFGPMVDFCAANTEFPRLMLKRSPSEMIWRMGYKNSNGNEMGSLNSVMGLSVKDDEGKIRGKRGYILYEEMGSYANFKETWDNVRDSVKEGSRVFSQMIAVGTAGDDASDFAGVKTMLYNPSAYEVYAIENVFDQNGKGSKFFAYFFPSYISRAGCMDKDGNSDVVAALLEILMERWMVKQGGDAASLLSRIAQMPITPAEAILKVKSNFFPVVALNERLRQIDQDPRAFDDVYVGTLVDVAGKIEFRATDDIPIRKWPVDNTENGALEIYEMPPAGNIPNNRYIIGHDPVDNDRAESSSLSSTIVFDLFTDKIVAEYTGRRPFADDNFEMLRLLGLFYNASIMVEANRKGYYAYFAKMHSTWMLADCPEYLRDRQLVKYSMFGSAQKGITVNAPIIGYANDLIRDWLNKTYPAEIKDERGEVTIQQIPQLYRLRNRALIEELIGYGPEVNTDRIRALDQVMLYREHFIIMYGGSPENMDNNSDDASDDEFFDRDWQRMKDKMGPLYKSAFDL
jgi:hypothetical protein